METEADKRDARIRKIQALLANAEDKAATQAESDTYYAKAQELMTAWAIDEELLKMSGKASTDVIKTITVAIPSTYFMSMITLWQQVVQANDCFILMRKGRGKQQGAAIVTGYESDLTRVQLMVTSMQITVLRDAQRASKEQAGDYYFRRSFIQAFALRIGERLKEQRTNSLKATGRDDLLPALVDRAKQVKDHVYATQSVGRARPSSNTKYSQRGAYAGRDAANRADIGNKQVSNSRKAIGTGS